MAMSTAGGGSERFADHAARKSRVIMTNIELPSIASLAFHHVGVACRDFDAEERAFAVLGYRREGEDFLDPIQGIHGRFLVGGGPRLELLRNAAEPGVLTSWLRKGVRFYHMAYEVDAIHVAETELLEIGAKAMGRPVPAIAFGGRPICFYMLPNLSLVELIGRA